MAGNKMTQMKNGSVTLEASMISTLIFIVLITFITGAFYFHDRAVLKETVTEIELRTEYAPGESIFLSELLQVRLQKRLMMSTVQECWVSVNGRKIKVYAAADFRLTRLPGIRFITGTDGIYYTEEVGEVSLNVAELVRAAHGIIWRKP